MNEIKDYDFVDCVMVDFEVDKKISTLSIITEAYFPLMGDGTRKKSLLCIQFLEIGKIELKQNEEFKFDLSLPYNDNDSKANEVYFVEIEILPNGMYKSVLNSDMLKFELVCKKFRLEEVL